ncbi:hypothetical protein [Thalassobius sp. Cn5-15]|nr:hypothetical protein [Thalassobius sp. Cn5-15]MCG7494710.1 hypothetical protein [Thalassobius sp. Cn5-15]
MQLFSLTVGRLDVFVQTAKGAKQFGFSEWAPQDKVLEMPWCTVCISLLD